MTRKVYRQRIALSKAHLDVIGQLRAAIAAARGEG